MGELTLKILDEAISQIERFEADTEIIGFRLHPEDLRSIREKTAALYCVSNNKFTITPPYKGMKLVPDDTIPPGYPEPLRKKV